MSKTHSKWPMPYHSEGVRGSSGIAFLSPLLHLRLELLNPLLNKGSFFPFKKK